MLTSGMTSTDSVEWGTPDELFKPLDAVWDFTLDGAASHANAKCDRYCTAEGTYQRVEMICSCPIGPVLYANDDKPVHDADCRLVDPEVQRARAAKISELDGLNFPWKDERVFLNPPWGTEIGDFLRKAHYENLRYGTRVVAILPARMDTAWMHDWVLGKASLLYKRGRTKFIDPQAEERKA